MPDGFVPGSLVRSLHARSGVLTNLVAERRREDEVALRLLGASGTFLDYPVASYRVLPDGRAPDSRALWRDLNPDDERLVWAILADVAPRIAAEATIHAPIGLGGHVDHRIVRRVGQALADQGRRVVWYEDLPYAARSSRRVLADTTANPVTGPALAVERPAGQEGPRSRRLLDAGAAHLGLAVPDGLGAPALRASRRRRHPGGARVDARQARVRPGHAVARLNARAAIATDPSARIAMIQARSTAVQPGDRRRSAAACGLAIPSAPGSDEPLPGRRPRR